MILKVFFRMKVYGQENIPKKGGFILASNHVSYIDPPAVGAAANRRVKFMAREDLFSHPLLGWWLRNVEVIPVKRDSADLSALKAAMKILKQGRGLALFPEGRRSTDGKIGEPEPGIGFLAAKTGVPVIPTFVSGTEKALPKGAKKIKPHQVSVCFGKQILIERRMPYQDIANNIMQEIRHLSCPK